MKTINRKVHKEGAKLLFLFWFALLPLQASGKMYVVLVGVSEYANPAINLKYCHQDAIDMYELLKIHTTSENMVLLINQQAYHNNIVYYTRQLFQKAQPEDIVIFYFSGHGSKNSFSTHDNDLSFSTLQSIFKQTKARRKLIIADACYAGALRQPGNQAASNNVNMGNNVLLFLSSRSGQKSNETSLLRNGIFTHFLLDGLRGEADANRDGYITAKEIFNYVYPKVKEHSKEVQIPVMWGKFDANLVILKK